MTESHSGHRRFALKLRELYPGWLPDQLITALLEEQPPRHIAELEWAVLNERFRRMGPGAS